MSSTIPLVACVARKAAAPRPAAQLYPSALFLKASAYAARNADAWYILSAKYGLVDPHQIIAPYDETLNRMPAAQRRAWGKRVLYDLCDILLPGDTVIILAGQRYREHLVDSLEKLRCRVEIPMVGMRIGEQLRWLNQHL